MVEIILIKVRINVNELIVLFSQTLIEPDKLKKNFNKNLISECNEGS